MIDDNNHSFVGLYSSAPPVNPSTNNNNIMIHWRFLLIGFLCGGSLTPVSSVEIAFGTSGEGDDLVVDPQKTLPTKKTNLPSARQQCSSRIRLHVGHVSNEQKRDMEEARGIMLNGFEAAFKMMPDDISNILVGYKENSQPCIYLLEKDNGYKVGESSNCTQRINQQSGESLDKYTTIHPNLFIKSKLIKQGTIDALFKLVHLPSLGGIHSDKRDLISKKLIRQLAEIYITCSYHVAKGPVGEWVVRAPSENEAKLVDVKYISNQIKSKEEAIKNMFSRNGKFEIRKVHDRDTWITLESEMWTEEYQNIHLFLRKSRQHLSGWLSSQNVDNDKYGGFANMVSYSPYLKAIKPLMNELRETSGQQQLDVIERIEKKDEFMKPDKGDHANSAKMALADDLAKEDNYHVMIRVRSTSMSALRDKYMDWYEETIIKSIELNGKQLVIGDDGNIDFSMEEVTILKIHRTKSCHIILERGSHYIAYSSGLKSKTKKVGLMKKLNSLHSYLYESVLLNQLHLLSKEQLYVIEKRVLSTIMQLIGITKRLDGSDGSIWNARDYILPPDVSPTGRIPGDTHMRKSLPVKLPYRPTIYILHQLGAEDYNNATNLFAPHQTSGSKIKMMS